MDAAPAAWDRAQTSLAQGDLHEARRQLAATLQQQPDHAPARVLLAGVDLAQGRLRDACAQLLLAQRVLPGDAATVCRVSQALMRVGESAAVRDTLCHDAIARCRDGATLAALAHVHQQLGQHPQALALMDRACEVGFDNADFRYFRAIQLQFNGRLDEAEAELEHCLRLGPSYGRALLTLVRLRPQTRGQNHLDDIRRQMSRVSEGSEDHAALEFAQYKTLEDWGEYDDAFAALQRANGIMHRRLRYDADAEAQLHRELMAVCDAGLLEPADAADIEGPVPIFIVGLPRSGTTVLDRVLGNHARVTSAGELSDFAHQLRWSADIPGRTMLDASLVSRLQSLDFARTGRRYLAQTQWRSGASSHYVDKLPANFLVAGLIAKALPQARVLHLSRDPMDVCFSNYRALFGDAYPYSYDLASMSSHHHHYRALMAHWKSCVPGRILDVNYEALVTEPERVTREVLDFCGLPPQDGCTDIARNRAPVATLSSAQVRERIHARGIGEWKRYAAGLESLRDALQ